jgi:hypothetical protein
MWIVAAGFQIGIIRMLPSSMRGFKFLGMFSSALNLGLAIFYFSTAFKVGV